MNLYNNLTSLPSTEPEIASSFVAGGISIANGQVRTGGLLLAVQAGQLTAAPCRSMALTATRSPCAASTVRPDSASSRACVSQWSEQHL